MVAYLVALAAAQRDRRPVLVTAIGAGSEIATLAGVRSPVSLAEAATRVARRLPLPAGFAAKGPDGLRVLVTGARPSGPPPGDGLVAVLGSARRNHALTVVDCGGVPGDAVTVITSEATHLALVISASSTGVEQARAAIVAPPPPAARELIVAVQAPGGRPALMELKRLAAERRATLIMFPSVAATHLDRSRRTAAVPLQAILGVLTR